MQTKRTQHAFWMDGQTNCGTLCFAEFLFSISFTMISIQDNEHTNKPQIITSSSCHVQPDHMTLHVLNMCKIERQTQKERVKGREK